MINRDLTAYVQKLKIQEGLIEICLGAASFGNGSRNARVGNMRHGDYYYPRDNGDAVTLYLKFTCPTGNGRASVEILKNGLVNHRELALGKQMANWTEHMYGNIAVKIDPALSQIAGEAITGGHRGEVIITQVTIYKERGAVISSF